jgi:purine operon repressor
MSLSKRSLRNGSKCIFIDDFMKGGGTAKGITDLLKEFDSNLIGIGVLVDNVGANKKLINNYVAIAELKGVEESGDVIMNPSALFQ